MEKGKSVFIVGGGPSSLLFLQSLSYSIKNIHNLTIYISEPRELGRGTHSENLPDYYQLNTICSEINISPYSSSLKKRLGAGFYEWIFLKGYKWGGGNLSYDDGREKLRVSPFDHVPRKWLGDYLHEGYLNTINELVEKGLSVKITTSPVVSILKNEKKYEVTLLTSEKFLTDSILISTGHGDIETKDTIPKNISSKNIQINGMGLSAIDTLCDFTTGLGGKFVSKNGDLKYIKSGKEPLITMMSRRRVTPFRYRPLISTNTLKHKAFFLKKGNYSQPLTSLEDVKEILINEMALSERRHHYFFTGRARKFKEIEDMIFLKNKKQLKLISMSSPYISAFKDVFDCEGFDTSRDNIISFIENDLLEAKKGLYASSFKYGLEVLRALRNEIRNVYLEIKNDNMLIKQFYKHIVPAINRNVICHQYERGEELLALIESRVVNICYEPEPNSELDLVIDGFVKNKKDSVFDSFKDMGLIKTKPIPGLYETNEEGRVNFESPQNIWALGPITEGSTYYNHYVPGEEFCHLESMAEKITSSILNN